MDKLFGAPWKAISVTCVRLVVGLVFLVQGILKYGDPHAGLALFASVGFPSPGITLHVVGAVEIMCGLLVVIGVFMRLASIPLLIIILTAIAITKAPDLWQPSRDFWFMMSHGRDDFGLTMGLLLLVTVGTLRSVPNNRRQKRSFQPSPPVRHSN